MSMRSYIMTDRAIGHCDKQVLAIIGERTHTALGSTFSGEFAFVGQMKEFL